MRRVRARGQGGRRRCRFAVCCRGALQQPRKPRLQRAQCCTLFADASICLLLGGSCRIGECPSLPRSHLLLTHSPVMALSAGLEKSTSPSPWQEAHCGGRQGGGRAAQVWVWPGGVCDGRPAGSGRRACGVAAHEAGACCLLSSAPCCAFHAQPGRSCPFLSSSTPSATFSPHPHPPIPHFPRTLQPSSPRPQP